MSVRREKHDEQILFYALSATSLPTSPIHRDPDGITRSLWAPSLLSVRPPGTDGRQWALWWGLHHAGVLAKGQFGVVLAYDADGALVHRATVVPRFFRFAFMGPDDLQIGNVWTLERWRGHGLATSTLRSIVEARRAPGRRFWYLTEASNAASRRLVERAGFEVAGVGRRKARVGSHALGTFHIESEWRPTAGDETSAAT
jgi:RimJ/RimL family protein N-acetyltransferase